jgi:hypothetical protein
MTRVIMAESLLEKPRQAQHQGWSYFLTGEKPWFFYVTDFEQMGLPEGAMPQSYPKTIISTPEVMLSMFYSEIGFSVILALPPITKCTASYSREEINPKIVEGMPFDLAT